MWRADFFDNKDDKLSSRSIYIDAVAEHIAAEKAKKEMGNTMRVDLVRTIIVGPDSNQDTTQDATNYVKGKLRSGQNGNKHRD